MNPTIDLPSYEELFGELDFKRGTEARSVYSPAAYLTDLVQIIEDTLGPEHLATDEELSDEQSHHLHLHNRRGDIKEIELNGDNTFDQIPYLEIVNELLRRKIENPNPAEDVREMLKEAIYPLNLPLNFDYERLKKLMGYLDVGEEELYDLFNSTTDLDRRALQVLAISQEEANYFLQERGVEPTIVTASYLITGQPNAVSANVDANGNLVLPPTNVAHFLLNAGLDGPQLRELLFQNLSTTALSVEHRDESTMLNRESPNERVMATRFFINHGLVGYATLNSAEDQIIWKPAGGALSEESTEDEGRLAIPLAWFDRCDRFIRLAMRIGFSFSDLDLILRNCCQNQLDEGALHTLAVVKWLHTQYELSIDVICSLFGNLNTMGIGDEDEPLDLFNRLFNHRFTDLDGTYLRVTSPQPEFIPQNYNQQINAGELRDLTLEQDILSDASKPFRRRLQKTLKISDAQLTHIVDKFREHQTVVPAYTTSVGDDLQLAGLSLIFRVVTLVEMLDISISELFDLLDILALDPLIRSTNPFNISLPFTIAEMDCYRILDPIDAHSSGLMEGQPKEEHRTEIMASLWLVQTLASMTEWMQKHDLTTADLKQIQSGTYASKALADQANQQAIARFTQTAQAFLPFAFKPEALLSDMLDGRSARVVYETLLAHKRSIVSATDPRVLRFDAATASLAVNIGLTHLAKFSAADFYGLGLADKFNEKLYQNLIIHGFLSRDGELNEDSLPENVNEFVFVTDFFAPPFSDLRGGLFEMIADIYQAEMDTQLAASQADQIPDDLDITVSLFLSDLDSLNLTHAQSLELHDNLIFNGYINADGQVLDSAFFADYENEPAFEINTVLSEVDLQPLFDLLQSRTTAYKSSPHTLDPAILGTIGLAEMELQALVENLRFNDYIDDSLTYLDKAALLGLPRKEFKLALQFYLYEKEILAALQADLATEKSQYFTLTKDETAVAAEAMIAANCLAQLQKEYLDETGVRAEWEPFFAAGESSQQLELGIYFTPTFNQVIFQQIQTIHQQAARYQFDPNVLEEHDLYGDEAENLVLHLIAEGVLDEAGYIAANKIDYFGNVNNALDFQAPGYDDFNKDIFFALHAVARQVQAARDEIVQKLDQLAASQEDVLFESLAEGFEIESDTLRTIARHIFYQPNHHAEAILNPILALADANGLIEDLPPQHHLNRLYRRVTQFVHLVQHLKLGPGEVEVVFQDQNLIEKFPETLVLPKGMTQFDTLLSGLDDKIYLFQGARYWTYAADTCELIEQNQPLTTLSPLFANLTHVDAAFVHPAGHGWIISGAAYFMRKQGEDTWEATEKSWGKIDNNFAQAEAIQAGFTNSEGVTYLFAGDQYVRYSSMEFDEINPGYVDPGYPKAIHGNWSQEHGVRQLFQDFMEGVDAAFESADRQTFFFKGNQFCCMDSNGDFDNRSHEPATAMDIASHWGLVNNNFEALSRLDAALSHKGYLYLFLDDQVSRYADQIENSNVTMDEGFPLRLTTFFSDLPSEFEFGIDGIFHGADDKLHIFKNNHYVQYVAELAVLGSPAASIADSNPPITTTKEIQGDVATIWGRVRNNIQDNKPIDAAFTGLDGCTYLFSGEQFFRYSGRDYTKVDEGFPRTIAGQWGGLTEVGAAFILDGKTYLFSKQSRANQAEYVCYSTNDYTTPDEGFPKPINQEEWWNLPDSLTISGFAEPDAIFISPDNTRYLFKGNQFISFNHLQRWWSEPATLDTVWNGLEASKIDAAFTGRDGKTYLFSNDQFVRYSDSTYSRLDDRYPRAISSYWGQVVNQIERTRRIDSAFVVTSEETRVDEAGNETTTPIQHTYLFSGNQFFRYAGNNYEFVEEGYPRTIQAALHLEPRFQNLAKPLNALRNAAIDAAFADERTVYLIQGETLHAIANGSYHHYENFSATPPSAAMMDEGQLYLKYGASNGANTSATNGAKWVHHNNPETASPQRYAELPNALRSAPKDFQQGLDAVLQGTDQNTYLFMQERCFNCSLERTYPIKEEWGRVRNNVTMNGHVDAAFVGTDGYTYLFCGDQFARYAPDAAQNVDHGQRFIDGLPQPIADSWGGLTHIHIAFTRNGMTYLLEQPDEFGEFRYVTYSDADYTKPDTAEPQVADFDWWEIPSSYQEEGFTRVDAVLTDEHNLFLIQGRDFIQYNQEKDIWTYAKPLDRVWRGLSFNETNFSAITTAFQGSDGQAYFFSEDRFAAVSHSLANPTLTNGQTLAFVPSPAPILKISDYWGHVENAFVQRGVVDAAFVWNEQETYLFSGDQYVKYSSSDYRFVDDGYPKSIAKDLRSEPIFNNLPETFEMEMSSLAQDSQESQSRRDAQEFQRISAVVANKGTIYLFIGQSLHVVSPQASRTCSLSTLGHMQNRIQQHQRIDAAVVTRSNQLFLFAHDQLFRYTNKLFSANMIETVDEGYPKKIHSWLNGNEGNESDEGNGSDDGDEGAGNPFTDDIDAAIESFDQEGFYLFKGDTYIHTSAPTKPMPISAMWGKVRNGFALMEMEDNQEDGAQSERVVSEESSSQLNIALDAAFITPDGKTYLFKGDQFLRYSRFENEFADEGYPLPIKNNWGNLPAHFEEGIHGGFVFDGKTYLMHEGVENGEQAQGAEYVRYSRPDYRLVDNIYPQKVADRWRHWGDFLLADIRLISAYKQLQDQTSGRDISLTDFLNGQVGDRAAPYQTLHHIFGWDHNEIMWLKRRNTFLPTINGTQPGDHIDRLENRFELETIEKMAQIFRGTRKLGVEPSAAFAEIWQPLFDPAHRAEKPDGIKTAADHLYSYLGAKNSQQDWAILKAQIHDELNLMERDIWVPLALAQDPTLSRPKELFELLLIDVEMGNAARTSKVKEAISAIQLYLHRYLVNLEAIEPESRDITPAQSQASRDEFKERWQWLKNYRLWEANRKVFLYPENYIRPELRDTKTPEFEKLEEILLQGELNSETAEAAFSAYLESFGMVGNLKIAGANIYEEKGEKVLVLFGHTKLEPRQFFYRTARFSKPATATSDNPLSQLDEDLVVWAPWEKVDVSIASDRVFPIQANGRLMVFWIEIEDIEEPEARFRSKPQVQAGKEAEMEANPEGSTTQKKLDQMETISEVNTTQKKLRHEAQVKYSLLKYNNHWTPPQEIKRRIELDYEIDAAYCEGDEIVTFVGGYCSKTTNQRPEGEMKRIEEFDEFKSLPSSFHSGIDAAAIFGGRRYLFKGDLCVIQEGGSSGRIIANKSMRNLLDIPAEKAMLTVSSGVFNVGHSIVTDIPQTDSLLYKGTDAAFTFGNNILTLVDSEGKYTFFTQHGSGQNITLRPIQDLDVMANLFSPFFSIFIATIVNRAGNFRPADAVFQKDSIYYVLRDGQYECYDDVGTELIPLDGFPKPIRGNLSFNMDQFFNKLHLQNTLYEEDKVGPVHISYTSPKEKLLLYGKLKPDFTFEEIPVQEDRALMTVLNWQSFAYSYWIDERGYAATYIKNNSSELVNILKVPQEKLQQLNILNGLKNTLGKALSAGSSLVDFRPEEDAPESVPDTIKADFDRLISNIINEISTLREGGVELSTIDADLDELLAFATSLSREMNGFYGSLVDQEEDLSQIERQVRSRLEEGVELNKKISKSVSDKTRAIKEDVGAISQALGNLNRSYIQPDKYYHAGTATTYQTYLDTTVSNVEIWEERLGVSNQTGSAAIDLSRSHLAAFMTENEEVSKSSEAAVEALTDFNNLRSLSKMSQRLESTAVALGEVSHHVDLRAGHLAQMHDARRTIVEQISMLVRDVREALLGTFDLFPPEFGIANTTNFAFSEPNRPDWHIFEAKDGTFLCRPLDDADDSKYQIIRLTTSVIPHLSRTLFAKGVMGFLSAETQRVDESPAFTMAASQRDESTINNAGVDNGLIRFNSEPFTRMVRTDAGVAAVLYIPDSDNLDFHGASGIYYAELFFHAPYLIAQALNGAQKFDEAKRWYETIFDPTLVSGSVGAPWRYLPFQTPANEGDFLIDSNQIKRHLDDPFDPHALAALRPTAYRKAIVMSYIDNLLDWGDMLFRQYSIESINEARMLYVLAHDLLGDKPDNLGSLILPPDEPLKMLTNTDAYDFVIEPNGVDHAHALIGHAPIIVAEDTPNKSVGNPYFFVPENRLFGDYWSRVDDRLYKIRHSLNIDGKAQPLPLFQPPIDPMAVVRAVAGGANLGQLMAGASVQVPHYRFEFLAYRAQNLVQKLNQYGGELLATLEKKDAEALSLMQSRQEGQILNLMIDVRNAQIQEAEQTILNLEESRDHAQERIDLYAKWLNDGKLPEEIHQINLMIAASVSHYAGSLLKLGSMIANLVPSTTIGPFSMGVTTGGRNIGESLSSGAELAESLGEGLSVTGEVLATEAQIKHMFEDWEVQLMIAESEIKQIGHQLEGARIQKMIAQYELGVLQKEIEHNQSIQTFMQEKFTNQQLYQWMIGKMSGLYFQTYQMAFDMAKMAEKAYQFERGLEENNTSFIHGGYWDSRHKGLLAGEQLALDLDRMEQEFVKSNERRLEITKEVSLLELDPLAFLQLKQNGTCEFSLDEAFFDYDFPGHFGRQVKTMAVEFDLPEGVTINATLTQLNHQTVLKPDPKAVKFLLDPKDQPPTTIRSNWRGNQQIVLSHHDEYEKNNGMFELRYDTDYYLPFEGTGAVSRWRLELNGKPGSIDLRSLVDATVRIQYTARQGGSVFAEAVKGMLKPYQTTRFFDMTYDFADAWNDFLDGDEQVFELPFTRDLFPNMSSSKISGIFTRYELEEASQASMILNGVGEWELNNNAYLETNGLSISSRGTTLSFEYLGNKENLRNVQFVFSYKAAVG